jgi:predicted HicB family RNase H-like nuclease
MGGIMPKKDLDDYKQDENDFVYENSNSLWEGVEPEERKPKVRLNVDISENLHDRLVEKARKLKKTKSELLRVLLDRALDE